VSTPLLALRGVGYRVDGREILRGLDLELHPGERVALVGANGAGKTTLLHLLVGLRRPAAGQVVAFGRNCLKEADFVAVRRRVGLLFQDSDDQLFCPTVLEDVAFGPLNLGRSPRQARDDARQALAVLGLEGLGERVTHRLSAGEKRLVALATVLSMKPDLLLLDEPTNGLDSATEERLVAHLAGLPQAMVLVSHDMPLLARLATRALCLTEGRLRRARLHTHPHVHRHLHVHLEEPALEPAHDTLAHVHRHRP
jgi:cobalt/nickel transport system ATP-binding protein